MKKSIISLEENYEVLNKEFLESSKRHKIAEFLMDFSKASGLKIFFDSNDYFSYVNDYSKAGDFEVRKNEKYEHPWTDDFSNEETYYFDFFVNLDFEGKKFPFYLKEKGFFENVFNIICSRFFSHTEREHQIYWTNIEEIEKVSHPEKTEKIISYYKNKNLNPLVLKNLERKIVSLRKENPEIYKTNGRTSP